MSKPIIEVTNISKKFTIGRQSADLRQTVREFFSASKNYKPEIWALKDINFTVEEGEVLGLIGPNGSGKSTLLKILSRITYPTTGKAVLRGRVSSLLEVGTGFHPELTGRENIFLNGSILGMKKAEIKKKFDEIVDFSGVEQFIDTPVKHFSSGMYVRLAFSVAAHLEPEILLVDEVLSVGDLAFRQKSMGKMNEVAKQGRTVIFVSHNLQNIQKICNKGIFLKNGNIFSKGEMTNVSDNYLSESRHLVKNSHFKRKEVVEKIAWIEEATIDVNNNQVNFIYCGDSIDFRIKYKSKQKDLKASFFIGIFSAYSEKLLHFSTSFSENEVFNTNIEGFILCKIPKFPLSAGQYFVNLSLNINDLPIDRIENAFVLTVKEGDFFNISKAINYKGTKFLVNHFWQIK